MSVPWIRLLFHWNWKFRCALCVVLRISFYRLCVQDSRNVNVIRQRNNNHNNNSTCSISEWGFFLSVFLPICCHSFKGDVCTRRKNSKSKCEAKRMPITQHTEASFNYEYVNRNMQAKRKVFAKKIKIKIHALDEWPTNVVPQHANARFHFLSFSTFLLIKCIFAPIFCYFFSWRVGSVFALHIVRGFVSRSCLYINRLDNKRKYK